MSLKPKPVKDIYVSPESKLTLAIGTILLDIVQITFN